MRIISIAYRDNGQWRWGLGKSSLGQDLLGTTVAYNPEAIIATLCNKIMTLSQKFNF